METNSPEIHTQEYLKVCQDISNKSAAKQAEILMIALKELDTQVVEARKQLQELSDRYLNAKSDFLKDKAISMKESYRAGLRKSLDILSSYFIKRFAVSEIQNELWRSENQLNH